MRDRRTGTLRDLREAVECLPHRTRLAMLEGIERNPIIVGAYSDEGGICPMLAAHRAGGRTNFIGFAKAWDGFAFRGSRKRRARRASERELLVLRSHLQASLLEDECPAADLDRAVSEHRRSLAAPRVASQAEGGAGPRSARPPTRLATDTAPAGTAGDADRSRELGRRPGWRWMRLVRSVEEFESVLAALEDASSAEPQLACVPGDRE